MGLSAGSCDRSNVLKYDLVADTHSCKSVFLMHETNRSVKQNKPHTHTCTDGDIAITHVLLDHHFVFFATLLLLSLLSLLSLSSSAFHDPSLGVLLFNVCWLLRQPDHGSRLLLFTAYSRLSVCGLSGLRIIGTYHKLLTTNDEGRRVPEQDPRYTNRDLSWVFVYIQRYEQAH